MTVTIDLPTNHRSSVRNESIRYMLGKSATVLAFAFPLAFAGCGIAYYIGVPLNQLAVAVSTPLTISWLFMRVMIAFSPSDIERPQGEQVSALFMVSAVLMLISFITSVSCLLSVPIYYELGLRNLIPMALKVSIVGALSTGLVVGLALLYTFHRLIYESVVLLVALGLWKIFLLPRRLAHRLLAPLPSFIGGGPRAA